MGVVDLRPTVLLRRVARPTGDKLGEGREGSQTRRQSASHQCGTASLASTAGKAARGSRTEAFCGGSPHPHCRFSPYLSVTRPSVHRGRAGAFCGAGGFEAAGPRGIRGVAQRRSVCYRSTSFSPSGGWNPLLDSNSGFSPILSSRHAPPDRASKKQPPSRGYGEGIPPRERRSTGLGS